MWKGSLSGNSKKRGFNVFGTDIDKTTKEYFSDKGIEIRIGSVVEAKWNKNFFDVITMWHVLEHDINPLDTVQECKNILMKDGLLIISVPNFNSLERKIFGKYWMYLSPPRHITQLTPTTLSNILKKTHMKIYKIRYPTLIPQLWSRSLLVYLENKGIIKLSEVSRILLTVALFPIAFPINVLSMIFKTGSVMNVYVKVNE